MKLSDPTKLSLILAIAISLLFAGLVKLLFNLSAAPIEGYYFAGSSILFFVIIFFMIRYSVKNFIFEKIRVIYKTIHQFKKSSREPIKPARGQDTIEKVNQEVLQWQKDTHQQIEDLKQRARYRREFIGNVSHELKTPIFNIQGYVLTLLDGAVDDPQINKQYLERTENSVNRLINIVEDLENISQLESGALKLREEHFNVVETARDIVEQLEIKAHQKGIRLYFRKKYDKIQVKGDHHRIRQVFTNLIDNSIKYGTEGGTTKISFFDMHDHILCEVTDNGPGIPEQSIPRLFERFYRTDKARSREKGGTGLGLAIVKHIIEAHNQTINVRSKEGVGTTFAFTLKKA
ncbi:MAG: sensor histidine kinase [Bacteroidales bacterium]|nr:sensor histidine kinase [Bacteroidales bacterium]